MIISVGLNPALPCDTGARGRSGIRRASLPLLVLLGVPLRWWCRLDVSGRNALPPATRVCSWLPTTTACSTRSQSPTPDARRPAAALPGHGQVVEQAYSRDGAGRRPADTDPPRGGDTAALQAAVDALVDGEAICIFPEGGLSGGQQVRARTGVSRIIQAAPEVQIVLAAVSGAPIWCASRAGRDFASSCSRRRAPRNPVGGSRGLAARLLGEIRERVRPWPRAGAGATLHRADAADAPPEAGRRVPGVWARRRLPGPDGRHDAGDAGWRLHCASHERPRRSRRQAPYDPRSPLAPAAESGLAAHRTGTLAGARNEHRNEVLTASDQSGARSLMPRCEGGCP